MKSLIHNLIQMPGIDVRLIVPQTLPWLSPKKGHVAVPLIATDRADFTAWNPVSASGFWISALNQYNQTVYPGVEGEGQQAGQLAKNQAECMDSNPDHPSPLRECVPGSC